MARGVFSPANTFISITERHVVGNSSTGELSFGQIQRAFKRKEPASGDSIRLTDYYLNNGFPDNPETYTENNTIPTSGNTTNLSINGWASSKGIRYNTEGYYYLDDDATKRTITISHSENVDKDGARSDINASTGEFNFGDFTQFNQKVISITPANIDRIIAADEITGNATPRSVYRYLSQEINYDLDFGTSGGDKSFFGSRVSGKNSTGVIAINISANTIGTGAAPKVAAGKVVKTWAFGGRGASAGVLKYPGDEFAANNFGVGGLSAHRDQPKSIFRTSLTVEDIFKGWRGFEIAIRLLRLIFGFGKKKGQQEKSQGEDENGSNFIWKVTASGSTIDRPGILVGKERNRRRGQFQNFNLNRFTIFME